MPILKAIVILGGLALLVGFAMLFQQYRSDSAAKEKGRATLERPVPLPEGSKVNEIIAHPNGLTVVIQSADDQVLSLLFVDRNGDPQKIVTLTATGGLSGMKASR
ncbi:MAG: hypothetical protein HQL51_03115 [Magnetococcales bacterium]|nr:hypothetical protein [Magnetococcales bacterium]